MPANQSIRLMLLIVLLATGPVVLRAQPLPEWYRVHTFDDSFIDINTYVVTLISDDVARVRFRWTFAQPQSVPNQPQLKFQSRLEVKELNCTRHSYRHYHLTFFDQSGNTVAIDDKPGPWRPLSSGMIEKLFVTGCSLITTKTRDRLKSPNPEDQQREAELAEAAHFASEFVEFLEQTKDFRPVIKKFFVPDYLARYLQDKHRQWFFNVSSDTASRLDRKELERFYIAVMNAGYLSSTYVMSQLPVDSEEPDSPESLLPPDVLRLIKEHPTSAKYRTQVDRYDFLEERIEDAQRLHSYTALMEGIGALLRLQVRSGNASRQKAETMAGVLFRFGLAHTKDDWKFYHPTKRICGQDCLGLQKGTSVFEVDVPMFHLQLARVDGSLKVISIKTSF